MDCYTGLSGCSAVVPDRSSDRPEHVVTIGPHRLFLGDAYTVMPELGWFDALVMDPQYKFDTSGGGKMRASRAYLDQIEDAGLNEGFDHKIINPLLCGAVVVFCHNDQLPGLLTYLDGSFERFVMCSWHKSNPMPVANRHYLPDTEPYIHAWNSDFAPVGSLKQKARYITTPVGKSPYEHPTVKPDAVMDKIVANVGGRTICDPFMGTGSTGVAAVRAGRVFTGIEHNLSYFEIACERIAQATQEASACHQET